MSSSTKIPLLLALVALSGVVGYYSFGNKGSAEPNSDPEPSAAESVGEVVDDEKKPVVDLDSLKPAAREIAIQVPKAKKILAAWRKENPEKGERNLHVVYWTPADKAPAERYQERLGTIFDDIQKFYGGKMESLGFGKGKTIGLDKDADGKLKIHFVRGKKSYASYKTASGPEIRMECLATLRKAGISADLETLVIFCNMSVWDPERRAIRQNSPYYALGTNTTGTAWQVDSPILKLKDLTNAGDHVFDGQYGRISLGKYNTIFIGGITHELGHAFGLPHNLERKDEAEEFGVALMGSGNRAYGDELRGEGKGAFLTLAHGLKLASHPMFSGYVARMHEDPKTKVENLVFKKQGKGFTVSGKVTGSIPPYAVLAYMDPAGGSDYNATTTSCVPNEDGSFTLNCQALTPGKAADLNLVFVHANGKATSFQSPGRVYTYPYSVDRSGNADISQLQKKLALTAIVKAIESGDKQPLSKLPSDVSDEIKEHAQRLVKSSDPRRHLAAPEALPEDVKSVILTDCKWESQRVGFDRARFDRGPKGKLLLQSARGIHATGVFAHARSKIVYSLGGRWKHLNGVCAHIKEWGGLVNFKILADGKVIYDSGNMKANQCKDINISLQGVSKLELITSDGGDGVGSDWSAWLDMKLSR